ncbi:hypothetical protein ACHQM5_005574 [Ranunculus cassubicifolius]
MATKTAIATLVLRFLALVFLAGSVVVFVTNKFTSDGDKTTFKDVQAYRYVVAAALLGFIYSVFQIPFALYHVSKEKHLARWLPAFNQYADQIMAYFLATAVGAGFAITMEYKKRLPDFIILLILAGAEGVDDEERLIKKFLNRGLVATGILLLGFVCVALQAVISAITRYSATTSSSNRRGFFG